MKRKYKPQSTRTVVSVAAASLMAGASTFGASIQWSAPVTVTSENDISLAGTVVHAGRWGGSAVTVTVGANNIVFQDCGRSALGTLEAAITSGSNGEQQNAQLFNTTGLTLSSSFATVMQGNAWENSDGSGIANLASQSPMVLSFQGAGGSGLTLGQQYQIQLFYSDDRTSSATRSQLYSDSASYGAGNMSASFFDYTSPYVIGTFTADAPTQQIYAWNTSGEGNFPNGFGAYVLEAVPEPSVAALGGLGSLAALMLHRRKRN